MNRVTYIISKKDLFDLFARLSETYRVFVPYKKGERLYFDRFDPDKEGSIELGMIRQTQPFKSFLTHSRENVLGDSKLDTRPVIVAGVKGCDLESLKLQDHVFKDGDYKDPFYVEGRESTVIISCDCFDPKETCFCLAMGGRPHPKENYDINLSYIDGYFVAEIASLKGLSVIEKYKTFFKDISRRDVEKRDSIREASKNRVKGFIDKRQTPYTDKIQGVVKNNYNLLNFWQDQSSTCVECGACNLVCPTCHCFLLFDMKGSEGAKRYRIWDSCLYNTFARVAGGANPRRHLYERLRNRFDKKFAFFPETMNYFACTGCGRCIEACPGDIDIREVLKGLVNGSWRKPPHE